MNNVTKTQRGKALGRVLLRGEKWRLVRASGGGGGGLSAEGDGGGGGVKSPFLMVRENIRARLLVAELGGCVRKVKGFRVLNYEGGCTLVS